MTDEQLCSWLESTGFSHASEAASRIRNKNIEIESFGEHLADATRTAGIYRAKVVEQFTKINGWTPPPTWPPHDNATDPAPPVALTRFPEVAPPEAEPSIVNKPRRKPGS